MYIIPLDKNSAKMPKRPFPQNPFSDPCPEVPTEGNTSLSGRTKKSKKGTDRSRGWAVTINNWTPEDWDKIQSLGDWGVAAQEIGEQGTPHIQGAFYFKNKISFSTIKNELPKAHIEPWLGTARDNKHYIFGPWEKDGKVKPSNPTAIEWGDMPQQGARKDLETIRDNILNGQRVDEIVLESPHLYHQYGRTLTAIEDIALRRNWRTEFTNRTWYYGRTAVGKSHTAFEGYHVDTHYNHPVRDKGWWDNYRQQHTVIINDFRGEIPFNDLLQLVDKWPYDVPRRGRPPMPFTSKEVIITSSCHPREIYSNSLSQNDRFDQFTRRFRIVELHSHSDELPPSDSADGASQGSSSDQEGYVADAAKAPEAELPPL